MLGTQREQWVTIGEFPNYQVSNRGEIFNLRTKRIMRWNLNNYGNPKITLTDFDGERYDRSIAKLVADAFVVPPGPNCDHIIILDGDFTNMWADNLAWRPDGFAYIYTRQLKTEYASYYYNLPVRNVTTGVEYQSVAHACVTEGLLFRDVWRSTYTGEETFPDGSVFEVIKRV